MTATAAATAGTAAAAGRRGRRRCRRRGAAAVVLALGLGATACGARGPDGAGSAGGAGSARGADAHDGDGGATVAAPADGDGEPSVATAADRGSFSVPCAYSHSAHADPIVHPGDADMAHHHDFFGATTTDGRSTAASLAVGDTTCRSVGDTSAYWTPALLAGGTPVPPVEVVAYYRAPVGADARQVQPPPDGLEMVAGDAAATRPQDPATVHWSCDAGGDPSPVPLRCDPRGSALHLTLALPPCWDSERLRSADHRSHLAGLAPAEVGSEVATCPPSHPVLLPEVTLEVRYPVLVPPGALTLASGPPTGGHGDVLVAWDEEDLADEVATCVQRNLRCDAP